MDIELGYRKETVEFHADEKRILGVLTPNPVKKGLTGEAEVVRALDAPIGKPRLEECVKAGQKVVVITSDISRPMPTWTILPPVVERLEEGGIRREDITVVFALGSHRGHTEEERKKMLGSLYGKIHAVDSDPNDVVHLGTTTAGTPVDIFRTVTEADFVLAMGNIEYHYFAGYSGGAKALMPGVSTPDAIQVNHKMMTDERAHAGNMFSPVRVDIEECLKYQPVDYIVNVVLDERKQVIHAVAGDVIAAHRVGCDFLDSLYKITIKEKADIVVVSAGGYPKDQNMYQAQKALDNAKHAVKDGGAVIWLAGCDEGLGSKNFERWMTTMRPEEMMPAIKKRFELGGHKAAAVAAVMARADIYLISELDSDFVKSMGFLPAENLETAFRTATEKQGKDSTVIVMPYGGSTLPLVGNG